MVSNCMPRFCASEWRGARDRADEMETVNKLIAGLDRAAGDLSTLVQYGRPIELQKQPGVDVQKIMRRWPRPSRIQGVETTGQPD